MRLTAITIVTMLLGCTVIYAQPTNDMCEFATFIPDVSDYCSEPAEFTNVGATADPSFANLCFLGYGNGVWFSFVPRESAINVRVFGQGVGGNTLSFPQIALFDGCGNYVTCSPGRSQGTDEFVIADLIIGNIYYIMVESAPDLEGTFQLCINDFFAPPSPQSDCSSAVVLCDKRPFTVNTLNSVGNDPNEANGSCIGGEKASSWYVWECDQSGTLTMELIPSNLGIEEIVDDLDFIVFELPNGIENCNDRVEVLCMGSGANVTNGRIDPVNTWALCNRATGMREGETDTQEFGGCNNGSNNYIAPLNMVSGRAYGLLINNFTTSGLGFSIEFGGSGTFRGPSVDVSVDAVQAFECDKTIIFSQNSTSLDSIVRYTWNLGAGATPSFSNQASDQDVIYASFGDKVAALTVESEKGCTVTEVIEFFVEPCCQDTSTLEIDAEGRDLRCFNLPEGSLVAQGLRGSPRYEYSVNGQPFQPNPNFNDLMAGIYTVIVRDIKGCVDTGLVTLTEPPPISVNAGPDITIDLGSGTQFGATVSPPNTDFMYTWEGPGNLTGCTDCPDPQVTPTNNGLYSVTITDENGCTATSSLRITVNFNPQIMAPNIFSPNGDRVNELFNLYGNAAVAGIDELRVYDRWGNLVYLGENLMASDRDQGWDGTMNGTPVTPGVYTWMGKVRFINDEIIPFGGDITVIR